MPCVVSHSSAFRSENPSLLGLFTAVVTLSGKVLHIGGVIVAVLLNVLLRLSFYALQLWVSHTQTWQLNWT